ncbi:MAG: SGNH/GDSL hydrolase family protein [Candidatus Eremiobacteraeota bacterium]|nr:SGNH/GDSL hydrolase family protein [Candidatus Eremiobacteraeota bacterium]
MKMLPLAGSLAVALLASGSLVPADAGQKKPFDRIVVFGDSLSDQGNTESAFGLPPAKLYYHGRYSDYENYIDLLAGQFGIKVTNSLARGGTNYAYGFATTGPQNAPPPVPFTPQRIDQQEQTYLSAVNGKADPKALYVIESGATDILGLFFAAETDPLELLLIPTLDLTGTANVAFETKKLLNAGAEHIIVSNVPDLGLLPVVTESSGLSGIIGPTAANDAAELWNYDLANDVLPLGPKVTLWDFYNTTSLALAIAPKLGITNTTTECVEGYGTTPGAVDSCTPTVEATHAFFDQVHFTGRGFYGMEQGALCALGYTNVFDAPQSECVVSQNSMHVGRSGRFIPAATFEQLARGARTKHT